MFVETGEGGSSLGKTCELELQDVCPNSRIIICPGFLDIICQYSGSRRCRYLKTATQVQWDNILRQQAPAAKEAQAAAEAKGEFFLERTENIILYWVHCSEGVGPSSRAIRNQPTRMGNKTQCLRGAG